MLGELLAVHAKFTVCTGAAAPVPVRVVALGEFDASLVNEATAEADPVAPGVNVTVKGTGWLVVTVTGNERPLIENSEGLVPPMLTEDAVTLAAVALKVPVCVPFVPTVTLPTLIVGVTLNCP